MAAMIVALGLGLPSVASAIPGSGTLFGSNGVVGDLITVDTGTGAGTIVGPTGTGSIPALATDPVTGILYAGQGGGTPNLYTVNKTTGAAILVGSMALGANTGVGDMDFRADGVLFASVNKVGGGGTGSETLATINTATGAATVIGPMGVEGMEGLAFGLDGTLWGAQTTRGAQAIGALYTINTTTGAATFVAEILDASGGFPSGGIASLRFRDDGTLYGGTARSGDLVTPDGGFLVTINTTTGVFSYVGASSATGTDALAGPLAALSFDVILDEDVDECADETDNCSDDATCTDTEDSFTCECNSGFSGDGVTCTDIDECTLNTDNCSANATCTNTVGSFTCGCNAGYAGDGVTCNDVDECTLGTDNCSENATCTNTEGSFSCGCNPGYAGDGVTCTYAPALSELGPARLWLGLKNSDDQGTQFDIKVELLKNGAPVAEGLTRCITGLTRAPAMAKEVAVPFDSPPSGTLASGDILAVRVSTRIGTTATGAKCSGPGGSHNAARGVRLYYDSTTRASRFDETIEPNASEDQYLHSNGGICPGGGGESPSVTNRYLDSTAPTATSPKCKDAGTINFAGGNPFAVVGTWSAAPLP